VLIAAPPGSGASTAALLGVLAQVLQTPRAVPRNRAWPLALLLCPTRELALQLAAAASKMVGGSQLAVRCVTGQTPIAPQV
jgi:superfamily II DNA/RNA helicase